jgi:hypothetical protein
MPTSFESLKMPASSELFLPVSVFLISEKSMHVQHIICDGFFFCLILIHNVFSALIGVAGFLASLDIDFALWADSNGRESSEMSTRQTEGFFYILIGSKWLPYPDILIFLANLALSHVLLLPIEIEFTPVDAAITVFEAV